MNYTASQVRRLVREYTKKAAKAQALIWEPIIDRMIAILEEKKMISLVDKVLAAWEADDNRWGGMPQAKLAVDLVLKDAADAAKNIDIRLLKYPSSEAQDYFETGVADGSIAAEAAILALGDKP